MDYLNGLAEVAGAVARTATGTKSILIVLFFRRFILIVQSVDATEVLDKALSSLIVRSKDNMDVMMSFIVVSKG